MIDKISNNSKAIMILCSRFSEGDLVVPYSPLEWAELAEHLLGLHHQPKDLLSFFDVDFRDKLGFSREQIERINRLIDRSGSIIFEMERYSSMGINVVTRADTFYPQKIKRRYGKYSPPLFYYVGNKDLLNKPSVGVICGGKLDNGVEGQIRDLVSQIGGGHQVLVTSSDFRNIVPNPGRFALHDPYKIKIDITSHNLLDKIKQKEIIFSVQNNRSIVLSMIAPNQRNIRDSINIIDLIYAQSEKVYVFETEYLDTYQKSRLSLNIERSHKTKGGGLKAEGLNGFPAKVVSREGVFPEGGGVKAVSVEGVNRDIYDKAKSIILELYGTSAEFRDGQYEAIETTMLNKRTLVVQKTGWGKSLVYFICTRLFRDSGSGVTMIVSPLLVLMENQIEAGVKMGLKCEVLNSTVRERREGIISSLISDEIDLLLITPESLLSDYFQGYLSKIKIGFFVIDEAHCISDWGHDFRLEYTQLNKVIKRLPASVPLLGTTATANDRVVEDLRTQLGDNVYVSRGALGRDSLSIQILRLSEISMRYGWILENLEKLPGSGIIYCLTRRDCDYLTDFLVQNGMNVRSYYSRDTEEDQVNREAEQLFKENRIKAIVATVKLGMGYDKGDVAFIIHYQQPSNIVSYYQQIGRAGRNIERAYTFLMCGEEDKKIQDYFIETAFPSRVECEKVMELVQKHTEIGISISEIASLLNVRRVRLGKALMFLLNEGYVYKEKQKYFISMEKFTYNQDHYDTITAIRRKEQDKMDELVNTQECYSKFIVNCLDDFTASACGKCGNCLGYEEYSSKISPEALVKAQMYLEKLVIPIKPRQRWAKTSLTSSSKIAYQNEVGICLSRYGDPGYGMLVKNDKYSVGQVFCDELLGKSVKELSNFVCEKKISAITFVPSLRSGIVEDFARRLGKRLNLTFLTLLGKRAADYQKAMQNSSYQCENALKSFFVLSLPETMEYPESILLVDDIVDSGWTLAVCGSKLMEAGCGKVYPFVLGDSGQ